MLQLQPTGRLQNVGAAARLVLCLSVNSPLDGLQEKPSAVHLPVILLPFTWVRGRRSPSPLCAGDNHRHVFIYLQGESMHWLS